MKKSTLAPFLVLLTCAATGPGIVRCVAEGAHPSVWVYPSASGNLLYATDTNGVRINDFSECGYKRGQVELPNVTNLVESSRWIYLTPLGGGRDDRPAINAALNCVATNEPNAHGFRGVVCLAPGEFQISSKADPYYALLMTNSGVVLKGSGSSLDTGTRLRVTFNSTGDVIRVASDFPPAPTYDQTVMTEWLVPAGTRTFRVSDTTQFTVGDLALIRHLPTFRWIHDLDMDHLAKTWFAPYSPANDSSTGDYERQITRIEGNWITVDTPLPQTFELYYGGGTIVRLDPGARVENCGVEDLASIVKDDTGGADEVDRPNAVHVFNATGVWVRNVVASGYLNSCVVVSSRTKFVTVAECKMFNPGCFLNNAGCFHNRYAFSIDDGEVAYVLVRDCYSKNSRHDYLTGRATAGPNAFVRCRTDSSDDNSGPHVRWATGALFDNVSVNGNELNVENRGNEGKGNDGHGWVGGNCAVWNSYAQSGFRVRNPPTARNWLIGSDGEEKPSRRGCAPFGWGDCWAVGADPDGTYDQSGKGSQPVQLNSLYYAQLQQRLKWPGSEFREYRLGAIGGLPGPDYDIPLDPSWQQYIQSRAGTQATVANAFDVIDPNQWTAFTFYFPIAPNEQVVAGSISLGLSFPPGDHHVYMDGEVFDGVPRSFTDLGWIPSNDGAQRYTLEVPPIALQDGQLNVAIDGNCGVDFAMLNLQVAPVIASLPGGLHLLDAFVRGGDYANQNFATNAELIVKLDSDASFSRRALLSWDVIEYPSYPGPVVDAKVRLYCKYSGQPGNEHSVAVVPDDSWNPSTVTWNNQPAANPPFAYWVPQPGFFAEFTVTPQFAAFLATPSKRFSLCIDSARDWGSHGDVAYASSEDPDSSHWPQLLLSFADSRPSIVGPRNQSMGAGAILGPLPVTIGDAETPVGSLTLIATSSVPSVIAGSEVVFGGSGSNRTVTITVPAGRSGVTTITLMVSDDTQVATASFRVIVECDPPFAAAVSISAITDKVINENAPLTIPFYAGYPDYPCGNDLLGIRTSSTNPQLFPSASLQVLPHSGASNHVVVITPAPYQSGSAAITIAATTGFGVATRTLASETFLVTVRHVEHPPQYVRITSPRSGDNLLPGAPALLSADAFDVETNLARIEFYSQPAQLLATATNAPYSVTWSNPPAGSATLYAIAYDTTGLSATSAPVTLTISAPVVYAPRLFAAPLSNSVVLVWLDSVSSNALQTATSLVPPITWSPVTNALQAGDGAWFYFVPPTEPRRFYRLKY